MRFIAVLLALLAFAAPLAAQTPAAEPPVVAEARAFMESYAADLSAGLRVNIVRRYDRQGVYFLGNGARRFESFSDVMRHYANQWSPPWRFAWRDLAYEPAGPDAVVVAGQFLWTVRDGAEPMVFSYTALLHRQDGVLRIRLENESTDGRRTPAG